MKNKCKRCDQVIYQIVQNNLCQKCYSSDKEFELIKKGMKFPMTSEDLINKYLTRGMTITDIVRESNSTRAKIKSSLVYFGIPIRPKFKVFDEEIFKKMNSQGAYLLGYIFTDGDFLYNENTKKYFLRIYSKHKEQIEKVKTILKTDAKIQHREQKSYGGLTQGEIFFLHIANESIINDLLDFGLTIHKNVDVKFPNIPESLKHHFIRGCWAGSGNVSEDRGGVRSSIIIGSIDFMKKIEIFLFENGLKKRKIYKLNQSKNPSFMIKYAHTESEKLYSFLYKGKINLTVSDKQEKVYKEYFKRKGCNQNS